MNLTDIINLSTIDFKTKSIDQDGHEIARQGLLSWFGRTVLWILSFGYIAVNPALEAGTKKVIDTTSGILSDANKLKDLQNGVQGDQIDSLRKSLSNLKVIQLANSGSAKQVQELDDLIQTIEIIKTASLAFSSENTRVMRTHKFINEIRSGSIKTREEFLEKAAIYYPEIELYKGVIAGTPEGKEAANERQRTETSLLFIYWVWLHNDSIENEKDDVAYQAFIKGQRAPVLKWESFKEICAEFKQAYDSVEKLDFLLATMAVHDLGKVEFIKLLAKGENVESELHDEILLHIFKNQPEVLASFYRLDSIYQQNLIEAWSLDYLGPQFIQAERPPAGLSSIMKEKNKAIVDHFERHDLVDFAGAFGFGKADASGKYHVGCVLLNEDNYQAWKKTREQTRFAKSEKEAYDAYLNYRAQLLERSNKGDVIIPDDQKLKLDVFKNGEDYAFMRLCCMLRYFYHEDAMALKTAYDKFSMEYPNEFKNLVKELNCSGLDGQKAILVYYAPAMLLNIASYSYADIQMALSQVDQSSKDDTSKNREKEKINADAKIDAIAVGLRFLNDVFTVARDQIDVKADGVFTIYARDVANTFTIPQNNPPPRLTLTQVQKATNAVSLDPKKSNSTTITIS